MRAFAFVGLLALANCALSTDYVDVTYGAVRPQEQVLGASSVGVTVLATDVRFHRRDRVSSKRNGFGEDMAPIISNTDVIAETGRAIGAELAAKGFRLGGQDAQVRVEVVRFYNEFHARFWSGDAVSEITLKVQVVNPAGQIVYSHVYSAHGLESGIQMSSGKNAEASLKDGLRKIVPQVVDDPALLNALLSQGTYARPELTAPLS